MTCLVATFSTTNGTGSDRYRQQWPAFLRPEGAHCGLVRLGSATVGAELSTEPLAKRLGEYMSLDATLRLNREAEVLEGANGTEKLLTTRVELRELNCRRMRYQWGFHISLYVGR